MLRPRRKDGSLYVAVERGTREAASPVFILVKDRAGGGHCAEYGQTKIITLMRAHPYIQPQCRISGSRIGEEKQNANLFALPKTVKIN